MTDQDQMRLSTIVPAIQRMARQMVRRRRLPACVDVADLVQAGLLAVCVAAPRFDAARASFATFAGHRARGAMLDFLREQDLLGPYHARRVSVGEIPPAYRVDEAVLAWVAQADPWRATDARLSLDRLLPRLPMRERAVVVGRYFQGRRIEDIGRELGLSASRISQLHAKALARLRGHLHERERTAA